MSVKNRALRPVNKDTPTVVARKTTTATLGLDEGLFELPGNEPLWIWVHTCPDRRCDCREALILATNEGRDALLTRGLPVRESWQARTSYADVAAQLEEFTPFFLDIDAVKATDLEGNPLNPLVMHPRITAAIDRMDGDVLDAIARLWYIGKGYPDQREMVLGAKSVTIPHWRPGELVAYSDTFRWVRSDLYHFDTEPEILFEAIDAYCIKPDCQCGDVAALFYRLEAVGEPQPLGAAEVNLSGTIHLKPESGQEETLARLWSAFCKRHPAYLARFAQRDADMKRIGEKTEEVKARPKIGRNDPCRCGSGKKYKKCCGSGSRQ